MTTAVPAPNKDTGHKLCLTLRSLPTTAQFGRASKTASALDVLFPLQWQRKKREEHNFVAICVARSCARGLVYSYKRVDVLIDEPTALQLP